MKLKTSKDSIIERTFVTIIAEHIFYSIYKTFWNTFLTNDDIYFYVATLNNYFTGQFFFCRILLIFVCLRIKLGFWTYYYYRWPIEDRYIWSERLIGDQHAQSKFYMPDWRPIGDRHVWSETDMPHRRQICRIGNPLDMLDQACRSSGMSASD